VGEAGDTEGIETYRVLTGQEKLENVTEFFCQGNVREKYYIALLIPFHYLILFMTFVQYCYCFDNVREIFLP